MLRRVNVLVVAAAAMLLGILGESVVSATTPISLLLPQGTAFSILGRSCGGIQEQAFATGFDATSGYPTGDVYLKTTCSAGGRGGHSTTYSAWAGVMWDFTGAVISAVALSAAPTVDPTFSAFDAYGNEVYNASNQAYLVLAPGFVPAPRVTGMAPTFGPASGGTTVSITGTGFTGATAVDFGPTAAASFTVNSGTSITAVSPVVSGAGTVDVTVTTAGGTDATSAIDQFTFYATPVVLGVSPTSGPINGGTTVTITGANFTGATAVFFGDTQAGFFVNDDTSITAFSPGEGSVDTVDVTVTSPGGTSAITAADQFNYTLDTTTTSSTSTTTTLSSTTTTSTSTTMPALLTCDAVPVSGCQPAATQKAQLLLKKGSTAATDKLVWQWTSGGTVALSDFADPRATTAYLLCLYDASGELLSASAPAGGTCGTKPCWQPLGTAGFKYTDTGGVPDGVTKAVLKAGGAGHGKLQVKGGGINLGLPPLPLTTPVRVQLRQSSSGTCWEATYGTATTRTATEFKAKSN